MACFPPSSIVERCHQSGKSAASAGFATDISTCACPRPAFSARCGCCEIDQDAVACLQPVRRVADMEQHLARQHVAMLLAGMGHGRLHALGAREDEMEDLHPVERRAAAEMAPAIARRRHLLQAPPSPARCTATLVLAGAPWRRETARAGPAPARRRAGSGWRSRPPPGRARASRGTLPTPRPGRPHGPGSARRPSARPAGGVRCHVSSRRCGRRIFSAPRIERTFL